MARISELHYSNAYAASSGVSEFLEVALSDGQDPADYTVTFYQANGSPGLEITLDNPGVQVSVDPDNGEMVYVISADFFNIRLTDPDGGGSNNYEAYALTDTSSLPGTVIDFYDIGGGTQNIIANGGAANGATSVNLPVVVDANSTTTTLQFNQPDPNVLIYDTIGAGDTGIACFVAGTMVDTPRGQHRIEGLRPGDLVDTLDHGPQPVRWIGQTTVNGRDRFAPICIKRGTLGAEQDIYVSPQHRVLVRDWRSQLFFDADEVLIAAKGLLNGNTIFAAPRASVTYVHIMFDRHEIIRTNGLNSESFLPRGEAMKSVAPETQRELLALFPNCIAAMARPGGEARHLARVRDGCLFPIH